MTCGIYMIQNIVNSKIYIGQAVDIERRWGEHKCELRSNHHINKHLQNAWNKYGDSNFEFTVICECDESQLNTKEIDYIAKLKTYDPDFGYNKTYGGEGGRHTEETRKKISESHKGLTHSEESKRKISEANKGRTPTEETRKKLSESSKGKILSSETKEKIRESLKGKPRPEETRMKISESHKGKTLSEEHKKNLSESLKGRISPNKGRTFSEEHKKNLSESLKGRTLSEEHRKKLSIPIVQIDPSTNKVVNVWGSSLDAEREEGFNHGAIIQCCKNKYNREGNNIYKGYKWKYLHEVD